MPGPFDGSTVLDLTRLAPGPFYTMILVGLGIVQPEIERLREKGAIR